MRFHLLLLPLALAACASTPAADGSQVTPTGSTAAATTTPDAALLSGYHWQLTQATDQAGQRIAALFVRPDQPLQLDFADGSVRVSNSCNGMGGSYRIEGGKLMVGPMMHTMMACRDPFLNRLDGLIGEHLRGQPAITLARQGDTPRLTLHTAGGDTLVFTGVPTPQTRYGGPGVTQFLEVAAQTVPCRHPLMPNVQCLDVRQVHYAANGLKTGTPGDWQPLAAIEGYTHPAGVRSVLRVKHYDVKNPPADAAATTYVLDSVVESEIVKH